MKCLYIYVWNLFGFKFTKLMYINWSINIDRSQTHLGGPHKTLHIQVLLAIMTHITFKLIDSGWDCFINSYFVVKLNLTLCNYFKVHILIERSYLNFTHHQSYLVQQHLISSYQYIIMYLWEEWLLR